MIKFDRLTRGVNDFVKKNSPTILTSMAVAGVVSTTILAIRATPIAASALQWENERRDIEAHETGEPAKGDVHKEPLEVVKIVWKFYIPTVAVGLTTIACIVGANHISTRRNAAIMSAYSLADAAFREYQDKVEEIVAEKDTTKIRDAIAKDRVEDNPHKDQEIIITGDGDVLCYDTFSGRYFRSNIETLRKAQNDINAQCINDMYASLNDFYRKIKLYGIEMGEEVGFNTDNLIDLRFSSILTEEGRPVLVMDYHKKPKPNYSKIW